MRLRAFATRPRARRRDFVPKVFVSLDTRDAKNLIPISNRPISIQREPFESSPSFNNAIRAQ
jgi:hypothetical protein